MDGLSWRKKAETNRTRKKYEMMKIKSNSIFLCFLLVVLFIQNGASAQDTKSIQNPLISTVWISENSDGTYKNPILHADYSDPDVCRVGEDYYMVASSFNCIPGLPILHSNDLVNWEIIGHALPKLPPFDVYNTVQHGCGVWAPCIRYHEGEFYIFYPDLDYGIYMIKAKFNLLLLI